MKKDRFTKCVKFLGFATVEVIGDVLGAVVLFIADVVGDTIVSIMTAATSISEDLDREWKEFKK